MELLKHWIILVIVVNDVNFHMLFIFTARVCGE